nr:hypothetical protein [Tanacetum cinerariifolium]
MDASSSVSRLSPKSIKLKNISLPNTKHRRRKKKSREVENQVRNHNKTHVTSTVRDSKANVSVTNVNDVNASKDNAYVLCVSCAGSESRPPMLNKENYVPWSSSLLRYAKSRANEKLIHNSILNGPYVRRMIAEPGDVERGVNVNETFHEQTDDELSERELK